MTRLIPIVLLLALVGCAGLDELPPTGELAQKYLALSVCEDAPQSDECLAGRALRAGHFGGALIGMYRFSGNVFYVGPSQSLLAATEELRARMDTPFRNRAIAVWTDRFAELVTGTARTRLDLMDLAELAETTLRSGAIGLAQLRDAAIELDRIAAGEITEAEGWDRLLVQMREDLADLAP